MFIYTSESKHFIFEGCGHTKTEAMNALRQALETHSRQYDLSERRVFIDDQMNLAECRYYETGKGYRNSELLRS